MIRKIIRSDLSELYGIYSDPLVLQFTDETVFTSIEMIEQFYESVEFGYKTGEYYEFVILWNKKEAVGTCSLHSFNWSERIAGIGYLLHRNYWKKGIMGEAVGKLIEFAFNSLNLVELRAEVNSSNIASRNMLMRLGFNNSKEINYWYKIKSN